MSKRDQSPLAEQEPRPVLARRLKVVVWIVSIIVLGLVAAMRSPYKIPITYETAQFMKQLPPVMALINTFVAALLLAAILCVVRKKYKAHQRLMTAALVLSAGFLVCYVSYHFTMVETKFGDSNLDREIDDREKEIFGKVRIVYLSILFSHIIAAAVSFPMILMTFAHAWSRNFKEHKWLARRTFPLWLYVAVTGPICYWMLKPFY